MSVISSMLGEWRERASALPVYVFTREDTCRKQWSWESEDWRFPNNQKCVRLSLHIVRRGEFPCNRNRTVVQSADELTKRLQEDFRLCRYRIYLRQRHSHEVKRSKFDRHFMKHFSPNVRFGCSTYVNLTIGVDGGHYVCGFMT